MKETGHPAPSASASQGAVSVIICSPVLGRRDWHCADARPVARQSVSVHEMVVVIDGNRALAKLTEEQLSDTCTVLARDVCGRLSQARNSGLTVVSTLFVAFSDGEAETDERWRERLMEPLADPSALGVGGRSIPPWDHGEPAWLPPELLWVAGCSYAGLPLEAAPVRNVFGGCAVHRRELFDLYGDIRSESWRQRNDAARCEEIEFCLRASCDEAHDRFLYCQHAIIYHRVPASRATVRYVARRSFADGRSKAVLLVRPHDADAGRQLETESGYARRFVARAFFAGLRSAPRRDSSGFAESAVLALSRLAAGCGLVAGIAFGVGRSSSAYAEGWHFPRRVSTERCDPLPGTGSHEVDSNRTADPLKSSEPLADASVVVCAYTQDRWADTVAAIESLQRQTLRPTDIILVIDHNDRLFERAKSLEGVVTIRNSRAQGASGSRNSGTAAAGGSVVAFLDDDAVAAPDWLEMLMGAYAQPNVAGVGGGVDPAWPAGAPGWFPEEFNWVVGATYLGWRTTTGPVRNLFGGNMSLRRDVWERVGGFREGFGNVKTAVGVSWAGEPRASWGEENEFCIRVSQACPDLRWIYEPCARVRHRVPSQRCTRRWFLARTREEGLAKAALVSAVGRESALGPERSYASHVLPAGIARGVREAIVSRDVDGLKRASAIAAGFLLTTAGFLEGRARSSRWLPR